MLQLLALIDCGEGKFAMCRVRINHSLETFQSIFDFNIPIEDIQFAIKNTSSDSTPGPEFIIPRTMKKHAIGLSKVLSKLLSDMLMNNYMPNNLKEARTTLLFKKGDRKDVKKLAAITNCYVNY